jgi:lysophospholipase L1-like esterase
MACWFCHCLFFSIHDRYDQKKQAKDIYHRGQKAMKSFCLLSLFILCACSEQQPQKSEQDRILAPQITATQTIVFIGDSIIARWTELSDVFPGSINAGISGQHTCEMYSRFQQDVLSHNVAIVIILGGLNDIELNSNPSPQCIYLMVQAATQAQIKVFVCSLLPDEHWSGTVIHSMEEGIAAIKVFNQELKSAASMYGYTFVNFYPLLLGADGREDESLYADGVHPNAIGYAKMSDYLQSILR